MVKHNIRSVGEELARCASGRASSFFRHLLSTYLEIRLVILYTIIVVERELI